MTVGLWHNGCGRGNSGHWQGGQVHTDWDQDTDEEIDFVHE